MTKKNTINESKLARFSAVAGAVLASGAVNSQIVYTDVNPDVIIDAVSGQYDLDFNSDAVVDVSMAVMAVVNQTGTLGGISFTFNGTGAFANPAMGNGVLQLAGSGSSSTMVVAALNNGDMINAAAVFGGSSSGTMLGLEGLADVPAFSLSNYPVAQGAFLGVSDKFLGVKFMIGANTHYGWARLDVSAGADTIRVKDYAYNQNADLPILAGMTVGLDDVAVDQKVTIKTTLNNATINVTPDLIGGRIALFNMAGQEVKVLAIKDINTEIPFEGIETGIYTITAQFDGGNVTKKVYVK
jgi:hypothetical protein